MKKLKAYKDISIGFLLGILISGIFLLSININKNRSLFPAHPLIDLLSNEELSENIAAQSFTNNEKLNINEASMVELMNLPGIGEAKASSIIEFREKYGAFENIEELSYVSGIGEKLLESVREMVTIGHE